MDDELIPTTIVLARSLKKHMDKAARKQGISSSEFIRRAVLAALERSEHGDHADPFLSDRAVHRGQAPADTSIEHDAYLYGDRS